MAMDTHPASDRLSSRTPSGECARPVSIRHAVIIAVRDQARLARQAPSEG